MHPGHHISTDLQTLLHSQHMAHAQISKSVTLEADRTLESTGGATNVPAVSPHQVNQNIWRRPGDRY